MHTDGLPDEELLAAAREAQTRSMSPYSNFPVGCAMRLDDGSVVLGCNIESASFGLTNCAERVAIAVLVAAGHSGESVTDIVVIGPDLVDCSPCGACRQVLTEQTPHAQIWFRHQGGWARAGAAELMPHAFDASSLPSGDA